MVRLIYLPDYTHPMAINENPGLFGLASMKPTLQDGWMLTSLEGSGDSKTAETIGAVAQLIGSVEGGPAVAGAKAGATKGQSANVKLEDFLSMDGGTIKKAESNPEAKQVIDSLMDQIKKMLSERDELALAPGIYELGDVDHPDDIMSPVAYFCSFGIETKKDIEEHKDKAPCQR
jgi:hypothetical protein